MRTSRITKVAPLITVGINVFNGMPWLRETLASILGQTYRNFRVLIMDDGSTDGTSEYLRQIRDERVQITRQENQGMTATLNSMLDRVQTPWLVRSDADDISFPDRLATIARYIHQYPDTWMFYSRAAHYQNRVILGELKTTEGSPSQLKNLARSGYLPSVNHSSVVYKMAHVRSLGGYRKVFDVDYDMFARMARTGTMRFIPKTLVGYRLNAKSMSIQDMREHSSHILYVQYVLISEVAELTPRPYPEVKHILHRLIDEGALTYQTKLKEALVAIGTGRYLFASAAIYRAFCSAPWLFTSRMLYQIGIKGQARVGVDPKQFRLYSAELWPDGEVTRIDCSAKLCEGA